MQTQTYTQPPEPVCPDPETGLCAAQVKQRLSSGLSNRVTANQGRTEGQILLQNCLTFFNLIFVIMAVVLALCGSSIKNMTFMIVVIVNTVIGCVQEIRAKRAVDKLTLVAAQTVTCIRDGVSLQVRSDLLVRDDIVVFGPGDQICADGILRRGKLQVNESLITGEADAITKEPGDPLKSGSFVIAGRGRVQLTHVGDETFAAKLAAEAKKDPKAAKSEMMRSLDKLIRFMGILLIPVGIFLFIHEFRTLQLGLQESTEATVAALVGLIPQGLYLLTSVALAASAIKLTRQRVLVQDMNCIETLARVDVLCVDKTGTITEPVMEVENVVPLTQDPPEHLEAVLTALYGTQEPDNDTARAMKEMFGGESSWECTQYLPFTSQTKWCGGTYQAHGAFLAGAPEFIMGSRFDEIKEAVDEWSLGGYRVLLVAGYKEEMLPEDAPLNPEQVTPLALVMLTNRIRKQAPATFAYFNQQGVTIKVISGDNPATVSDVARRAGIPGAENYTETSHLETEADFLEAAEKYTVFGRVTPDQKKKLIQALKKLGHTVAMTGDGVNDVLALKESDCGIAMAGGSQAASQVARLVLLDADFAAMPGIVGEGRRVINNIQRAAALFIVKNIFSLLLAIINILTGQPYPLAPLQLTIISTLTIGTPSFFLALEPNYERVYGRFLPGILRRAFPGALTNIFIVVLAQFFMSLLNLPLTHVQTVCTALMAMVGMLVLFQVCKPFDKFRMLVWGAMGAGIVLCFTVLRDLFELQLSDPVTLLVMLVMLIATPTVFFALQRAFDWGEQLLLRLKKK